ncbi:MDR family MFS transporter [Bacillus fonticola]|uniref:MDR family MFS transporter n=1 Tax=Bacillus fonticola TaxID=2728853 RepID=UPI001475DEC6|nr:MDR family MFS transporter [Bacillus fonticola]
MLAMFMGAIEATIVATAMPAIAADLGDFSLYSWVFSSYLLMNAVTVLIYGKLSDVFGRKPMITFGIIVFLVGSILSGLAESMTMLILFRFLQGFGAGAVLPMATTIVGDLYTKEERAKIQGYLSSVWGISAVLGPAIGGILVEQFSWEYVFWLNVPIGLVALVGIQVFFHENMPVREKQKVDVPGAVLLTIGLISFMYVLVEGGVGFAWLSVQALLFIAVALVAITLFVLVERRQPAPILPFSLWKRKSIFIANMVSLTTGVILIGISSFLPPFVQGVLGASPIVAGFTLTTMSIGWPIASTVAGSLLLKIGERATACIGGVSLVVGSLFFVLLNGTSSPLHAAAGSFFVGIGMGLTSTAFIVSIQSTVPWHERGVATAANMFMRSMGTTIGAALLGGIVNSIVMQKVSTSDTETPLTVDSINLLLSDEVGSSLPAQDERLLLDAFTNGLDVVYWIVLGCSVISMLWMLRLPRAHKQKEVA